MKPLHITWVLLGAVSAAACTTVGNGQMKTLTERSAHRLIVPGKTTQAEIETEFGKGESLQFDSGYEIWVYEFTRGLPKFIDYVPYIGLVTSHISRTGTELRILFDSQGVVKNYLQLDHTEQLNKAGTS